VTQTLRCVPRWACPNRAYEELAVQLPFPCLPQDIVDATTFDFIGDVLGADEIVCRADLNHCSVRAAHDSNLHGDAPPSVFHYDLAVFVAVG
jgi:hypothetical protein